MPPHEHRKASYKVPFLPVFQNEKQSQELHMYNPLIPWIYNDANGN